MFTSEILELIPDKFWLILSYEKVKNRFLLIRVNYRNGIQESGANIQNEFCATNG